MAISTSHVCGMSLDEKIALTKQLPASIKANLREFTLIVAGIATISFPDVTREEIALKFDTPIARRYVEMNQSLIQGLRAKTAKARLSNLQDAIKRGADVNYTFKVGEDYRSALGVAYEMTLRDDGQGILVMELLLKKGANPNVKELKSTLAKVARKVVKKRCPEYKLLDLLQQYEAKV